MGLKVRALAALNHRHLVRLYGFCMHVDVRNGKQDQILVYEFVNNGDLSKHVHKSNCEWAKKITAPISRVLVSMCCYLIFLAHRLVFCGALFQ